MAKNSTSSITQMAIDFETSAELSCFRSNSEYRAVAETLRALAAERDENWQKYVDSNEARIDAEAALAAERDALRAENERLQLFEKYANRDIEALVERDLADAKKGLTHD